MKAQRTVAKAPIGMRISAAAKRFPRQVMKTGKTMMTKTGKDNKSEPLKTVDKLAETVRALATMDPADVPALLARMPAADVTKLLTQLKSEDIPRLVAGMKPKDITTLVLPHLDPGDITKFLTAIDPGTISAIMGAMTPDEMEQFMDAMKSKKKQSSNAMDVDAESKHREDEKGMMQKKVHHHQQQPSDDGGHHHQGAVPSPAAAAMLYDLERKNLFMESDKKKHLTLAWVRMLSYVYGLTAETRGKDVFTHVKIIKAFLKERFNHDFPLAHDRVYVQHGATNMATIKNVYTDTVTDHKCFMMSSSGYCAMGMKPEILDAAIEETRRVGTLNYGSCGAIGVNEQVSILNQAIAKYYKRKIGLSCVGGFLACQNLVDHLITSGGRNGDEKSLVLLDQYAHRSLSQGALQADKVLRFKHNNAAEARRLLEQHAAEYGNKIVIIESVYSTVGDIGDLPGIKQVCDDFGCQLICDDAHGIGVLGPNAGGVEDHFGMVGACDYICGTLSKSCSSQGGFVASNHETPVGCLVFSPGIGFATGMNSFSATFATKALEYIMDGNGARQVREAARLRAYLQRKLYDRFGFRVPDSPSRLCTIVINHPTLAMHIQCELLTLGYYACFFVFPACLMHQSLLRITIIPDVYTDATIDGFVDALGTALERTEKIRAVTHSRLLYPSLEQAEEAAVMSKEFGKKPHMGHAA